MHVTTVALLGMCMADWGIKLCAFSMPVTATPASYCQSRSSAKSSQCVILLRGATYIWSDKKACKVDSMHLEVMQCTKACS